MAKAVTVTLLGLLDELGMDPSRSHKGKGARNERELLRYKAHVGEITAPTGGWKWSTTDDKELPVVRSILVGYRDRNEKAPSGWRNLPRKVPRAANQDSVVGEGGSERRGVKREVSETKEEATRTSQQPRIKHEQTKTAEQSTAGRGVKREVSETKEEPASTSQQPRIKHEQSRTAEQSTTRLGVKREVSETKEEAARTSQQPRIKREQTTAEQSTTRRGVKREVSETKEEATRTSQQPRIKHEQSRSS
jgi:hypothetical protein